MPDRGTAAATGRSERGRKVRPETVILVGGALGVAAGMSLVSLLNLATSNECFASGMVSIGGAVLDHLRSGALIGSMIGLFVSLLMLWSASNEVRHRFAVRLCWTSFLGALLVAASYPLAGLIGCAAT